MDSRRRFSTFSHYPLLLLSLIAASALSTSSLASVLRSETEKVKLDLYYETLCPYCSNFIVNYLPKLFDTGLISAVDLRLFPYGNARVGTDGTITCQHGPSECLLNTVEACAIDAWPKLNKHFAFIYCVENLVFNQKFSEWETCFHKLGLDRKPIDKCCSSGYGNKLELKYAAATNALEPPHEYVPWVVVDGQPLRDDYEDFMSYICKAYKGSSPPAACHNLALITIPSKEAENADKVSYRKNLEEEAKFMRLKHKHRHRDINEVSWCIN